MHGSGDVLETDPFSPFTFFHGTVRGAVPSISTMEVPIGGGATVYGRRESELGTSLKIFPLHCHRQAFIIVNNMLPGARGG